LAFLKGLKEEEKSVKRIRKEGAIEYLVNSVSEDTRVEIATWTGDGDFIIRKSSLDKPSSHSLVPFSLFRRLILHVPNHRLSKATCNYYIEKEKKKCAYQSPSLTIFC